MHMRSNEHGRESIKIFFWIEGNMQYLKQYGTQTAEQTKTQAVRAGEGIIALFRMLCGSVQTDQVLHLTHLLCYRFGEG